MCMYNYIETSSRIHIFYILALSIAWQPPINNENAYQENDLVYYFLVKRNDSFCMEFIGSS